MLNLDCPNCGKPHRIDSAFRGGVARCDSCGALIHVPTRDGKPIEAQSGRKKRPGEPDRIAGDAPQPRARRRSSGVKSTRRLPGKPVAVILVVLIVTLSTAAAWLIYQTALKARGQG